MKTISDVLTRLDTIIEWAKENNSPAGYFAVVYRLMTQAVQQGIATGLFDDGVRMEKLDVVFAQRYFDAFEAWQAGKPTSQAWQIAFQATQKKQLTVLQHILLGINAHIDLDLGIAAAQIQPGPAIKQLQPDFNRINQVIENLVDPVQDRLGEIFPLFRLLDWVLRTRDERFANKIIGLGRTGAWTAAEALAGLDTPDQKSAIGLLDQTVAALATPIHSPGRWLSPAFRCAYWAELGSIRRKIEKLEARVMPTAEGNQLANPDNEL